MWDYGDLFEEAVKGALIVAGVVVLAVGGCSYYVGHRNTSAKPVQVTVQQGPSTSRLELLAEDVDRDGKPDALLSVGGKKYLLQYDTASDQFSASPYRVELKIVAPNAR